ncbi:MAG: biopolymer transporter ExbD [Sedimentisphaerales bacterium]|nr:biopolymer transporter ExbD [Sedimentisphaerales bacterium]
MRMESRYNPNGSLLFHKPADSTVKMAPMIDMIFLLLIFFLVCAKWLPQENLLPFSFPTAEASQTPLVRPEPLTISIKQTNNEGCIVQIGQKRQVQIKSDNIEEDLVTLLDVLNDVLKSQNRFATDPVELTCEAKIKWDYFAKIYNVLYGAGLTDITIIMAESDE